MRSSKRLARVGVTICLIVTCFIITGVCRADFIFLKDGFVLQGRLLKQYDYISDPSGAQIAISKLGGFYLVDDSVRRIFFPTSLVASTEAMDNRSQLELFRFKPSHLRWMPGDSQLKPFGVFKDADWNKDGTRSIVVSSASARDIIEIDQVIDTMTPFSLEVLTRRFTGTRSSFLTRELNPAKVLEMLRHRLKVDAGNNPVSFDESLRVARFAAQAGWHDLAIAELNAIAKEHPTQLPRLAQVQTDVKRSLLRIKLEELDDAIAAGQHSVAQSTITNLDQEGAEAQELTKLTTLRTRYKEQNAELERLRSLLAKARQRAGSSALGSSAGALLDEVERELNLDNAKVLNVFLKMAEQEERVAAKGQPAVLNAEQLLSLAITGWTLGAEASDQSPEAARRLLKARAFLMQFLITDDDSDRKRLIADYLAKVPLKADEIVQLIDQLPPPRAETVNKPVLDLVTKSSRHWSAGVKYRVYLPPEYHHYRSYPLIILPPNFSETYETATAGWLEPAARKGFILAVPEWVDGKQDRYLSSDKEQEAVLEVLRDLRRRFRVDSNRVSLAGYSSGGSLVFDTALTRPHLFASAAVICGHTPEGIEQLRYNAQYLPFYIVDSSKNRFREKLGPARTDAIVKLFEYWIPKGYPSLFVEYQGRGFERLQCEIPTIVDWMSRKKRSAAMPELGKADMSGNRLGQEFRIIRPSASRFYWVGVDEHQPNERAPVLISAGWDKEVPNSLRCIMTGMKKARIWLNASMVNFENPVEIRIQGPPGSNWQSHFKKKIEPNMAVLLEDYYQRGDSKNLFVQYVDFSFSK